MSMAKAKDLAQKGMKQAEQASAPEEKRDPEEVRKNEYRRKYKPVRDPVQLARAMRDVQEALDKASAVKTELQAEYDVLRIEMIPDLFEEQGIENLRVEGVGRISLTADMFVSIAPGQKEGLFSWLNKHKLKDLIVPNVNSSTLRAFVKTRTKDGKPLPPEGILNVTPYTRASITKG